MKRAPPTLDAKNYSILREVQRNANLTNAELAARVRLSPSPCLTRVRELEEQGVITGYVALLDAPKVGLHVNVFIQVSLEKQVESALENFETAMNRYPEVMECYLMTGDSDYLIRVVVEDVQALQRFIVQDLGENSRRRQNPIEFHSQTGQIQHGASAAGGTPGGLRHPPKAAAASLQPFRPPCPT